ncbi:hypothetical protein FIBSPDRAFT_1050019 [Athelia psychrophila]|uniref:F-box domain-containing protein n=1 Tax=Athelia psychrophila TaxID=1759441 RepID=A0A166BCZ8_9AGAM|nr:hypothetical protein FIBSPDRAFT_1050019 [Fibularhizoctonia sp. CBS 109695]
MFAGVPNLRTVSYSICEMNFSESQVDLIWDQLHTWWRAQLFVEGYVNLLRRCPALVHCLVAELVEYSVEESYEGPASPLRHNLRSLNIIVQEPGSCQNLFDHLELPCLLELYIDSEIYNDDEDAPAAEIWQQSSLEAFILRSSCPLQRLVLDVDHFPMEGGLRLLEHLPELVEFGCSEPSSGSGAVFDTALVERLTISPDAGTSSSATSVLLPKLRVLALLGPLPCDCRAFLAMVESRIGTRNHADLQALYLYLGKRPGREVGSPAGAFLSRKAFAKVKIMLGDKAHLLAIPYFPQSLRLT